MDGIETRSGGNFWILFCIVLLGTLSLYITPYMMIATVAYLSLLTGLLLRSRRKPHACLMITGIVLDVLLVLVLELQRDAIATAVGFTLSPLQQMHILTSSIALLLYFPVLFLGVKRLRGNFRGPKSRVWHIRLGLSAFVFRSLGFILMFSLLEHFVHRH